ncbi:MAG: hypothetical protein OXU66_12590 [Gammaproteobacteria bacterium]|nr:hypothetical protein [Gammaproteobacteria bacterium]MDD9897038.1 hypothetical protein [Gammaproteobacteria bacterium]MDD9959758.1 hypothetical protein [Gammaproteobacteria bacterium]
MNKRRLPILALPLLLCFSTKGFTQLEGEWFLTINHITERLGIINFEYREGELQGFVDGGPIEFSFDDDQLEMVVDYRNGGGRLLSRTFTGSLAGDVLSGTLIAPHDDTTGTWYASRVIPETELPPAPVDMSGLWSRISAGMEKVFLDYTDAAQAKVDQYSYLDDPGLRCVSPGLIRLSGWPYPMEIIQNEKQTTILYESYREVRRVYMDGREAPEFYPNSAMGFSNGHWEGSTLVIETSLLKSAFVDQAGQPVSENARVEERITMSEDGQNLRSKLTLHDPENYQSPIIRYRQWRKTPDVTMMEYDCDSYPFYRGLEMEGMLEEFLDRMGEQLNN